MMYLPILFICFAIGDCTFVPSPVVQSAQMCISVIEHKQKFLEANKDKILAWDAACIKLTKNTGEI